LKTTQTKENRPPCRNGRTRRWAGLSYNITWKCQSSFCAIAIEVKKWANRSSSENDYATNIC